MKNHTRIVLSALFLSFVFILAGCFSSELEKSESQKSESESKKEVSTLRIAIPKDAGPLNIYTSNSDFDYLVELVFDKLFAPSPYVADPEPWLAESASQIDPLTWVVKLKPGITWHDGQPFTAEDVKFTFEYYRDGTPNRHSHHVSEAPSITKIEATDSQTVRFTCEYACPTLAHITLADLPILPKHIWQDVKEPLNHTGLPVGTGPFRLVEHKPDELYRFQANEQYFKGSPAVKELVMPVIKDPSATFNALRAGEIDIAAREVSPELLDTFKNLPDMKVVRTAPLSLVDLRLNYERPPFNQPEFRRALSLAIDRQKLVDTVLLGQGRAGTKGFPHPDSPWTNPDLNTPFDQDEAKRILEQLNFNDHDGDGIRETVSGTPLEFTLKVASTEPTWIRTGELVKNQLEDVGIRLTIQALDPGVVRGLTKSREFDIFISNSTPHSAADPDQFITMQRSGNLWKKELPYPEMDALFEEWKQTTTIEDRKNVLFRMQELFNRQPTSVVLYYPDEYWAYRTDAYDQWMESPGYGIVHKYSFLPSDARGGAVVHE
ncbi:ABC transporter substrate-binding protein [Paenibacillus abyssi]|uniref:Peptide ABC transporter substrate-binding protein n=1 Tax=Paenibacillus abyssi TaxID=1340531 RepID=A0A917CU20_9BACL|nr:ABC transporter substrate-binding protein [Paenibacillus abyssi]GGF97758.1 peptide ABC transporter substrate-binding protein [Paenibacillus abyssi]